MKKFTLRFLVTISFMFGMYNAHAGIPVIDETNIAQSILQVTAWGKQFTQMQQEITNTTGSRGLGLILNDPAIKPNLSANWASVVASIKASPFFAAERAKYPVLTGNPQQNTVFDLIAVNNTVVTDLFKKATGRLSQVENLLSQINSASDPASKQDLSNRLVNEQNAIASTAQLISLLKEKQLQDKEYADRLNVDAFYCREYGHSGC